MKKLNSKEFRNTELFLRNEFEKEGRWGIPIIKKQDVPLDNIKLIACSNTRPNDTEEQKECGVHFFVDDYRFKGIYENPERTLEKYSQYKFLLSPDFSTYAEMDMWRQIESVAKNRWCGAYWQSKGLVVVPTISWSTPSSYDFCLAGVEKGSIVAIGMIGCKRNKLGFMQGYNQMLRTIEPSSIICIGSPFAEMEGNIICVDYASTRRAVS